jgi:hypothetical protein
MTREEISQLQIETNSYKFLGWMNSWKEKPAEFVTCQEANHKIVELSYSNKGSDNHCICSICKIHYKYDSSG